MKILNVLIACFGLLFLAGCEKNEEQIEPEKESAITFKKVGDPRNPEEFMSPQEIKLIQEAFNDMKGKKLENPVIKVPVTRGFAMDMGTYYQLQDMNFPIAKLDGDYLYISVILEYYETELYFNTKILARIGKGASFKQVYHSEKNTKTYIAGDETTGLNRILIDYDCHFLIKLDNTSGYNMAEVSFPILMQWDQRIGYEDSCDAVIDQRSIKIKYHNFPVL